MYADSNNSHSRQLVRGMFEEDKPVRNISNQILRWCGRMKIGYCLMYIERAFIKSFPLVLFSRIWKIMLDRAKNRSLKASCSSQSAILNTAHETSCKYMVTQRKWPHSLNLITSQYKTAKGTHTSMAIKFLLFWVCKDEKLQGERTH